MRTCEKLAVNLQPACGPVYKQRYVDVTAYNAVHSPSDAKLSALSA